MVVLNRKEARFLSAQQAYLQGSPVMEDKEFDKLKMELKEEKSKIAGEGVWIEATATASNCVPIPSSFTLLQCNN